MNSFNVSLFGLYTPSCCSWILIFGRGSPQADWLQGLILAPAEGLLGRGQLHRTKITLARFWVSSLSVPRIYPLWGHWAVLWYNLKLSTRCPGSGSFWEVETEVKYHLCSAQNELQSDMQMVAILLGLKVPRRGQAANQCWLLLVPGLEKFSEKYGAHWSQMLLVWEILRKSKAWSKAGCLYGKATWNNLGQTHKLGGANYLSQVNENLDMVPACHLFEGKAQQRNNCLCEYFCLGESCTSSSHLIPDNSVSFLVPPHMSLVPQPWNSEGVSQCKSVCGPIKNCLVLW